MNGAFEVSYQVSMPAPQDDLSRWHVTQTYTATQAIALDSTHLAEHEGFKIAQFSSMFINQSGPCEIGGIDGCHDSDGARYLAAGGERRQAFYTELNTGWIFPNPSPMGDIWLDALHSDDLSWQGNTPNFRLALDTLPAEGTITPQGWISATLDPDQDNVGLWLHNDLTTDWQTGQSASISYWILAQDDIPEPWSTLGLRAGRTLLDFESGADCAFVHDPAQGTSGTMATSAGYTNTAVQLNYDLKAIDGNWAQIRCNFDPPVDLSDYDHLRLEWRGDPTAANSLEIGLIDQSGTDQRIFGRGYHHVTQRDWWGQLVIPYRFLNPWSEDTEFDPTQVAALIVSVVKAGPDDHGGQGRLAIDNVNFFNAASRSIPEAFSPPVRIPEAASKAAEWIASQQQATGLVRSWAEETTCSAHIYDQALALLVFVQEGWWDQADRLVTGLVQAQNSDGSWYKSYDCSRIDMPCVGCEKWEGDIAWAIYALSRYEMRGGKDPLASEARTHAAKWLAERQANDGCLVIDHTEGTLDAWWAFQSAGPEFSAAAEGVENCLLNDYWDEGMGRFKGGRDWWQPYLDNQTWGSAFLSAVGKEADARRALSYAYAVLLTPAWGGQLYGFDGQGGPWSVWNEGSGQYVAAGGPQAEALVLELLAQQRPDGALPGSPDEFSGGGVWTTRWHGIAPSAWLYFALTPGEPFTTSHQIWLPLLNH